MQPSGQNNSLSVFLKATVATVVLLLSALFLFSPVQSVQAQSIADSDSELNEGVDRIAEPLGLPETDIREIVANIVRAALGLLGIVMIVLMLYGGYLWMTAGGNDEQINRAKKVLINAAIGLAIILSAYAIVIFVMRMLGIGSTGPGGALGPGGGPAESHFVGSGALGGVINDHYPRRDQIDVPRNSKIVITFKSPILPESIIEDTNRDGTYGNCLDGFKSWANDCDRIKTATSSAGVGLSDDILNIVDTKTGKSIAAAVALASSSTVGSVRGVYTLVVKPLTNSSISSGGFLGSSSEKVNYRVRIGKELKLDDPRNGDPAAFQTGKLGDNYYEWRFTTATSLDLTPPTVTSVFPSSGRAAPRNSIIQIQFSEAMDPINLQGKFSVDKDHYVLDGGYIFLDADKSTIPLGSFNLSNGYRTLEFVSSRSCGTNACGGDIYCLPVCDKGGSTCDQDTYQLLIKAADTIGTTSFEARPFTGAADMAGNALDGDADGSVDQAGNPQPVFPRAQVPDNYHWSFDIEDRIDSDSPHIREVEPGLDATHIKPNDKLRVVFNKRMRAGSLYDMEIDDNSGSAVPVCFVPLADFKSDDSTDVELSHCPFIDKQQVYYFPIVPSSVEDVNFNCFYPGKGPNQPANPVTNKSPICDGTGNCCAVTTSTPDREVCCNGLVGRAYNSSSTCVNYLST